jgi:SAM-dependent methyltransferase
MPSPAPTYRLSSRVKRHSRIEPLRWVLPHAASLLDVGCNAGEFLTTVQATYPAIRLAGCDVNPTAVATARRRLPSVDVREACASALPFASESFDCVSCIEVLEHIPPAEWRKSLSEMRRVLVPGGRLILRTPHAGLFAWLDSNNVRFRLPGLYKRLIRKGRRDEGYCGGSDAIEWHYHFTRDELVGLAGDGWTMEACRYGGLFVFPIGDYFRWPFYRMRRGGHPVEQLITRIMALDYAIDYGPASYGILLVFTRSA